MKLEYAELTDFDAWIALAREVEPLFGPMADEAPFQEALKQAMAQKTAFCIRSDLDGKECTLKGGIIISEELNEILWFAVSEPCRGKGYGRTLLDFAVNRLNRTKPILVQTFDASSPTEGPQENCIWILDFWITKTAD